MSTTYADFLHGKSQLGNSHGFDPVWLPEWLIDFQRYLVEWSIRKGRAALFADCGMGKTPMQLVWAENVVRHTNRPVLVCTPLAVLNQTLREAEKFSIAAASSQDGAHGNGIVITNYERLGNFDWQRFAGIVCDESSILKSFSGATRKRLTRFMAKIPYRLLCTATAAPNDYIELGTSSEALGELSYSEMLKRFFAMLDDKGQKGETKKQDQAEAIIAHDQSYYQKLAYRVAQTIGQWRLKHHAVQHFWRWVASWARACRMPSDLGFEDGAFRLPPLHEIDHVIQPRSNPPGMLFPAPAYGMAAEREERRRTLPERVEFVRELVNHDRPAVVWCHSNAEGRALERAIADAQEISGATPLEKRAELYDAFSSKQLRVLVIKAKIGAWGLNWQHCNHVVSFPSHSYEQYYQSVRRCWRFGQTQPVTLDMVATEGEVRVLGNMQRKAQKADAMFRLVVESMNSAQRIEREDIYTKPMEVPSWL